MKKFIFSLYSLYEIKKTLKEKLQAEFTVAQTVLENAVNRKIFLEQTLNNERDLYEEKAKKGMSINDVQAYGLYFEELHDMMKTATYDIERANKEVGRKQTELIGVFREIKILQNLREKQYQEFKIEEEKNEKKSLEDILSFSLNADSNEHTKADFISY